MTPPPNPQVSQQPKRNGHWVNDNWPILVACILVAVQWGSLSTKVSALQTSSEAISGDVSTLKESVTEIKTKLGIPNATNP